VVHAKKRFGQHFLEPVWVEKLLRVVEPKPDEHFWEIGPGRGALTRPLAARAASVTAFEIDRELAADLRANPPPRFTLIEGDFLNVEPGTPNLESGRPNPERGTPNPEPGTPTREPGTPNQEPGTRNPEPGRPNPEPGTRNPEPRMIRVVGNLPYNVASPILFKLVELYAAGIPVTDATVMLQREVADRLIASPGSKDYGVLSILIQHQATAERVLALPPGAFRPAPKVNSAVVRLRFHAPEPRPLSQPIFVALTQAIFTRRRKTLANALLAFDGALRLPPAHALANVGIDGTRRPETLSVAELVGISDAFARAVL
jgi:16S rRNA (adenine1518-N6/adenine1519-N6)-dimethyltransferase